MREWVDMPVKHGSKPNRASDELMNACYDVDPDYVQLFVNEGYSCELDHSCTKYTERRHW